MGQRDYSDWLRRSRLPQLAGLLPIFVYAKKGDTIPTAWTEEPADVSSDTRTGLFWVLAIMTEAVAQPVLEERDGKLFEVEPEQQLTDDLKKAIASNKEYADGMA